MQRTGRERASGRGLVIGLLGSAGLWLACSPGKLPCDNPSEEWKAVCALNGTERGGSGGGAAGGSGGSVGDANYPPPPGPMTAIPNCAKYPTLGKMDEFFATRCGSDGACHTTPGSVVWKDLKLPGVWERMRIAKSTVYCTNAGAGLDMIDTADWQKSVIWVATRTPKGTCANGGMIIRSMPPQEPANVAPKLPPLDADENTCLEGFLKALMK